VINRIRWLPALVLLVNVTVFSLFVAYGSLSLRPDMVRAESPGSPRSWILVPAALSTLGPAIASVIFLRPIVVWCRGRRGAVGEIPAAIAYRAAHIPRTLAVSSLVTWGLVTAFVTARLLVGSRSIPLGLGVHMVLRPALAGVVAATATFFAADYVCRLHIWPALLSGLRIVGNARLRRVRVSHRLLALWLAISVLPLSVVTLTTVTQVADLDLTVHAPVARVAAVVVLLSISAAVGGAWLAWLVSRSIGRPLATLEAAMERLRDGRFDTRVAANGTDEIGALTEGFNLTAGRLAESYAALEATNRELAAAMDRILLLEQMKRALDRFVPETARREIEAHPDAPQLDKTTRDVSVLFLDIEGYAALSERLPRAALNDIVERYFSRFLVSIRAEAGEVNEIAGDGLMIIFGAGRPDEHAAAAVMTALAIREQTAIGNREKVGAQPAIVVNIGISSGECDVGVTRFRGPASERWTFTASGPVTNLAARLGDRAAGGQILMDAATAERVCERFVLRSLGVVALKNLASPVAVWEAHGAAR
jgi:class 3 adenylate cyclase